MSAKEQTRQFKPHPHLLYSTIFKQSGTLAKALCELVINSVDAKATHVDVQLELTGFRVSDDGRGFKDQHEIEAFFETFGTPHDEDEADRPRFGSFRMGRGQAFAWASTDWKSGRFQMKVDVKNKGFDYSLKVEDKEAYPGCTVVGQLYESINPFHLQETVKALSELVRYIEVPVTLNGDLISHDPAKEKWDHIDDDAYIRITKSGGVEVYNLGMFVRGYNAYSFGVNAIVVSRRQLMLCTARNEILDNQCQVWKRVRKVLDSYVVKDVKESGKRLTAEKRSFLFQKLLSGLMNPRELYRVKLVKLSNGQHVDLSSLAGSPVTVAEDGDPRAERMIRTKTAKVLSRWTLEQCHAMTVEEFIDKIGESGCWHLYGRPRVVDFDDLARRFTNEYKPVPYQDLNDHEKVVLAAVSKAYSEFCEKICLRRRQDHSVSGLQVSRWDRKVSMGDSDTADGWTDGTRNIWVNRQYVTSKLSSGPYGAQAVAALLVHELCHDEEDIGGHQHEHDFLELFHDTMNFDGDLVGRMVNTMLSTYLAGRIRRKMKIPASYKGHFAMKYNELTEPVDEETDAPGVNGENR